MYLELSEEQTAALEKDDRYPFSPRIRTLRGIRDKIRPERKPEPLPRMRQYEPPPRAGMAGADR
jgi:hypothetical protein